MTVFVDEVRDHPFALDSSRSPHRITHTTWCRLLPYPGDSLDELKALAMKLGQYPRRMQVHDNCPHFRLVPKYRQKALDLGAQEITARDWMLLRQRMLFVFYWECPACQARQLVDGLPADDADALLPCPSCGTQVLWCTISRDSDTGRQLEGREPAGGAVSSEQ